RPDESARSARKTVPYLCNCKRRELLDTNSDFFFTGAQGLPQVTIIQVDAPARRGGPSPDWSASALRFCALSHTISLSSLLILLARTARARVPAARTAIPCSPGALALCLLDARQVDTRSPTLEKKAGTAMKHILVAMSLALLSLAAFSFV